MTDQPHAPAPCAVPGPPPSPPFPGSTPPSVTGDARVDRALAVLGTLVEGDLTGHVEAFSEVHRLLQDALATLDGA